MKIQLRRHTFETNSSTQHTLTICKDNTDYTAYVGKMIVLGENIDESDPISDHGNPRLDPVDKLNMLWINATGDTVYVFFEKISFIKRILGEIGIDIQITYNSKLYEKYSDEVCWTEAYTIFEHIFEDKTGSRLINFVFNKDSWHDCYEDNWGDGCPYEKKIKPGNETIWERL